MAILDQDEHQITRDDSHGDLSTLLSNLEKVAKILSLIAIPIVVAVIGHQIQNSISSRDTNRRYVEIALSILEDPIQEDDQNYSPLRVWAVDLLGATSPVKLSDEAKAALISGEEFLPRQVSSNFLLRSDDNAVEGIYSLPSQEYLRD
jgi:hypothetical protein